MHLLRGEEGPQLGTHSTEKHSNKRQVPGLPGDTRDIQPGLGMQVMQLLQERPRAICLLQAGEPGGKEILRYTAGAAGEEVPKDNL